MVLEECEYCHKKQKFVRSDGSSICYACKKKNAKVEPKKIKRVEPEEDIDETEEEPEDTEEIEEPEDYEEAEMNTIKREITKGGKMPKELEEEDIWVVGQVPATFSPAIINKKTGEAQDIMEVLCELKNDVKELKKVLR